MSQTALEEEARDDAGLSLIELVVVVALVGIMSSVIFMILVNSWNTQNDVNSTTVATNEGQVYATSIERAVRNAEAIRVTGANTIEVRTTLGGSNVCQAFKVESGAAYLASGAASPSWPAAWIGENVSAVSSAPYFSLDAGTVTYAFEIVTEASPVVFQGTVAARNDTTSGGSSPCW